MGAMAPAATVRERLAALTAKYLVVDSRPSQSAYALADHLVHSDPLVERFESWARGRLRHGFSLDDAATAVGTSKRTLARRLQAVLGKSPLSYFQDLRVERAVHLLKTTDEGVTQIASRVGYADGVTLRTLLRLLPPGSALPSPAALERSNNLLCPEIPEAMFVTCLYAILDPVSGHLRYANAGHNLPIHRHGQMVSELRATGMPLGLFPNMQYEEKQITLVPGDKVLLYSDGLAEAHNREREMFGFPRLRALMTREPNNDTLIGFLMRRLTEFTGENWEQEDDVTFVVLACPPAA